MMVDVHSFVIINIPKQYHNILCHDVLYVTTITTSLSSTDYSQCSTFHLSRAVSSSLVLLVCSSMVDSTSERR